MPSSEPSASARSAAANARPAVRSALGATSMSMSRSESLGSDMPTSWVICRKVPPTVNSPSAASICPVRMRKMVLLPTPLGPTMAACSPGDTPKPTSKNNTSAPGGAYSRPDTTMLLTLA
ncbi:unannotated protein [freshwater metagenome]|uniref:Unannotated protein n=1 Tax=freshwater metagenome TaxID=449393 RepID=A0A6J6YD71_9ZZZZ